jgi:hypothetical protein
MSSLSRNALNHEHWARAARQAGSLDKQEWMRYSICCFSTYIDAKKEDQAVPGVWR